MNTETIGDGKWMALVRDTETGWEFVQRTGNVGVVAILAITPDGNVIFVEQYRPPVESRVIELPAGLAGDNDEGEDPIKAALRELEEETGWRAASAVEIPCGGPSSAGLTNETVQYFLAYDMEKVGDGGGVAEEGEDILVHEIPYSVDYLLDWFAEKRKEGILVSPKIFGPLFLLHSGVLRELMRE